VLIGAGAPGGQTIAYPWEFGSHGGLSADEVETFVVHPAALGRAPFAGVVRARDLHTFFWERAQPLKLRAASQ
jgi:hypothetical protein